MAPRYYVAVAGLCILIFAASLFIWDWEQGPSRSLFLQDGSGNDPVPFSEIRCYDIILDISPSADEFIKGATSLNYERLFDEDKDLKGVSEICQILGDAGISREDSVVIYGECQPCGGGPSAAAYVYWIMKYLGHEELGLLDGEIGDWKKEGLPTDKQPKIRPKRTYVPTLKPELLATYAEVKNGQVQLVDARPQKNFELKTIPRSINMPYDAVLNFSKLKKQSELDGLFADLDKDRPVAVYTDTGVKASMVCYALQMMGYSAKLYTWKDWMAHQAFNNASENQDSQAGLI